jgi:propanol-preferring alcohol dehydrogenase
VLVIAGIYLSDIPPLRYQEHLFNEREIRSVTANTRRDGEEFLQIAARMGIVATTTPYSLDHADAALADLAADRLTGAAVLHIATSA